MLSLKVGSNYFYDFQKEEYFLIITFILYKVHHLVLYILYIQQSAIKSGVLRLCTKTFIGEERNVKTINWDTVSSVKKRL